MTSESRSFGFMYCRAEILQIVGVICCFTLSFEILINGKWTNNHPTN